jgi:hypothetical protein
MFFTVVVVHSFESYLLEYFSFWIHSSCNPFAARLVRLLSGLDV